MKLTDANIEARLAGRARKIVLKFEVPVIGDLDTVRVVTRTVADLDELLYLDAIVKTALKNAQKGGK